MPCWGQNFSTLVFKNLTSLKPELNRIDAVLAEHKARANGFEGDLRKLEVGVVVVKRAGAAGHA